MDLIHFEGNQIIFFQRFPRDMEQVAEFTANFYFSPVCPLGGRRSEKDSSLGEIRQAELKMKRSGESHNHVIKKQWCFGESGDLFDEPFVKFSPPTKIKAYSVNQNTKISMVTRGIAQLGTCTLPVVVIKSTFPSLALVRYLLQFTLVNSYLTMKLRKLNFCYYFWEYICCEIWCIPGNHTTFGFSLDLPNSMNSAKVIKGKIKWLCSTTFWTTGVKFLHSD